MHAPARLTRAYSKAPLQKHQTKCMAAKQNGPQGRQDCRREGVEDAIEQVVRCYRDDLEAAHPGTHHEIIEAMAVGFSAALLLEMERLQNDGPPDAAPR